ncbi:MAG: hypothetical protein P4L78_01525 [Silvimonas sp.]|nr:hypothetical protein [Silvimonas sp.]MDR3426101.1 hypothetical protein [Silvimonas sp.]
MATYPVKFEGEDQWAVLQSTSMAMFCPVFDTAIAAHIFACFYWSKSTMHPHECYTDAWEMRFAADISSFLDELVPAGKHGERTLPIDWVKEMDPYPSYWSDDDGPYESTFDLDDLVTAFEKGDRSKVDVVMLALYGWRKIHCPSQASALRPARAVSTAATNANSISPSAPQPSLSGRMYRSTNAQERESCI